MTVYRALSLSALILTGLFAWSACGGNHHQSHMRQQIQRQFPGQLPPGIPASELPEPESRGGQHVERYCSTCHAIPSPKGHVADVWPAVVTRMVGHMRNYEGGMMMRMVEVPGRAERETIVSYLQEHALAPQQQDTAALSSEGGRLFAKRCGSCHALPSPDLHPADEWPAVVDRMIEHMKAMDREPLEPRERAQIVNYLQEQTGS